MSGCIPASMLLLNAFSGKLYSSFVAVLVYLTHIWEAKHPEPHGSAVPPETSLLF